jgi:myo-inositol-1(or 4)-monophosphatase
VSDSGLLDRCAEVGSAAAVAAGKLLMDRFRTTIAVSHKTSVINLVTEMDVASEKLIASSLLAAFPGHSVLAEETYADAARGQYTWVVDPIDGTTNYAHGFPFWAVSIGLEVEGELEWGVVHNPNLGETFTARRGGGAWLGTQPLRVSSATTLDESLLATGFPYDIRTAERNNLAYFREFALRTQAVRRAGSAALDLACVAAGRFDGFWELRLSPWDCAAGFLLVREAGGKITNFRGEPTSIYEGEVVASNGLIHDAMLEVIASTTG